MTNRGIGDTDALIADEQVGVLVDRFDADAYRDGLERLDLLERTSPALRERCRGAAERHFSLERVGRAGYRRVYDHLEALP